MNTFIITIYALTTLIFSGESKDFYSQSLFFETRLQCIQFYNENQATILNGLIEHARTKHESEIEIREAGCALVDFSEAIKGGKPKIIQKDPLYNASSI